MKNDAEAIDIARLKAARGARPISDVAKLVGITYQQLWYIENGKRLPSLPVLMKLCTVYDVAVEDVLVRRRRVA